MNTDVVTDVFVGAKVSVTGTPVNQRKRDRCGSD